VPPVITFRCRQISDWLDYWLAQLREEMDALEAEGGDVAKESFSSCVADIEKEAHC
jgi:fatty acid synthase subunit alpha